jgi:excisionase family DNA binding protein
MRAVIYEAEPTNLGEFMGATDAARLVGVTYWALQHAWRSGALDAWRPAKNRVLVKRADVEQWARERGRLVKIG